MSEIKGWARARFFGTVERRRVIVEADGSVLVWDEVAGHYTRCHSLSRRAERRIARSVADRAAIGG